MVIVMTLEVIHYGGGDGLNMTIGAGGLRLGSSNDRRRLWCLCGSGDGGTSCGAEQRSAMPGGERKEREEAEPEQGCSTPVLCRSSAEEATRNPPEPLRTGRRRRRVSRDAPWIARDGRRWIWSPVTDLVGGAWCCAGAGLLRARGEVHRDDVRRSWVRRAGRTNDE
ncbi:hypothetical protein U1Q18_038342 [Sarracenia purpurea var. burkii]